ncbi:MAG: beta-N-acetylhexosaminidase [Clostridia bacterium]
MRIIPKMQKVTYSDETFDIRELSEYSIAPQLAIAKDILEELLWSKLAKLENSKIASVAKKTKATASDEKKSDGENCSSCSNSTVTKGATLVVNFDASQPAEGYKLTVAKSGITICASAYKGVLYAIQSLRVGTKIDCKKPIFSLSCFVANDFPQYEWRGEMLDESRHFFGKAAVLRLLDIMSLNKLNVFHWHLTDDQGWRIEIKKYPLLTTIGSKREKSGIHGWQSIDDDGTPHSGFYTQDDIKEIVAYAQKLGIDIVPEIDMPGHFAAAFAAYSHLACRDIKVDVPWYFGGKYPSTHGQKDWNRSACIGKKSTYEFVFDVIDEIVSLFPFPYFHIGGDEAPKEEWKTCPDCQALMREKGLANINQLQCYFINEVAEYLKTKNRTLLGWNEVLEGNILDKSTLVQYWTDRKDKAVKKHLDKGGRVLLSKHKFFYFDMCYCQYPLSNTYEFSPYFDGIKKKHASQIVGVEGEMWTEWVGDVYKMDFQLFPRMQALAEVAWNNKDKDFDEFLTRIESYHDILDSFGVNYAETEIAQPKGKAFRAKETMLWYSQNQDRELERNRELKKNK